MDSNEICNRLEDFLQKMLVLTEQAGTDDKVKNWLIKKGRTHPHQVWETIREIEQGDDVKAKIKELGLDVVYAYETAETIALLHDTGRLKEIDLRTGMFMRSEDMRGTSHEIESCKIAQNMGISDKNILLPIKYHDAFYIEEKLASDEEFTMLSEEDRKKVLFFAFIIQDADKTANMKQYCLSGIKNTSETLDSAYTPKAEVTPAVKECILNGCIPQKNIEHTYIDALLRYLSLSFTFHFEYSKKLFKNKILDGIFKHVLAEIEENATNTREADKAKNDVWKVYDYLKFRRDKDE